MSEIRFENLSEVMQKLLTSLKGGYTNEDVQLMKYATLRDMAKVYECDMEQPNTVWEELKERLAKKASPIVTNNEVKGRSHAAADSAVTLQNVNLAEYAKAEDRKVIGKFEKSSFQLTDDAQYRSLVEDFEQMLQENPNFPKRVQVQERIIKRAQWLTALSPQEQARIHESAPEREKRQFVTKSKLDQSIEDPVSEVLLSDVTALLTDCHSTLDVEAVRGTVDTLGMRWALWNTLTSEERRKVIQHAESNPEAAMRAAKQSVVRRCGPPLAVKTRVQELVVGGHVTQEQTNKP